jgi:hypothetical protein
MSEAMTPHYWDQQSALLVDDIGIALVTLDHPQLNEPLHIASIDVDITSRGQTFVGWPCLVKFPAKGQQGGRGSLTIEAVDPKIKAVIENLKGHVSVLLEIVSRDDPDDVTYDVGGLVFFTITGDDSTISGELMMRGGLNDSWPANTANPTNSPGLFVI